ncbi:hypothetical protein OKHIF_35060 [Mycobacteroides chelonae]|jgi:hypothetical protein
MLKHNVPELMQDDVGLMRYRGRLFVEDEIGVGEGQPQTEDLCSREVCRARFNGTATPGSYGRNDVGQRNGFARGNSGKAEVITDLCDILMVS